VAVTGVYQLMAMDSLWT